MVGASRFIIKSWRSICCLPRRLKVFLSIVRSSLRWRRPAFALWLGPPSLISRRLGLGPFFSKPPFVQKSPNSAEEAAFFLVPDGLSFYFRLYAAGYSSLSLFDGSPELPIGGRPLSAFLAYILIAGVIPCLIYGTFRVPLLTRCGLQEAWPAALNDWFLGIPSRIVRGPHGAVRLYIHLFLSCIAPYTTTRQAAYWTEQNKQQTYYRRAAMSELCRDPGDWFSPGFHRWIFYCCAPAWSTYVLLVALVVLGTFPSKITAGALSIMWWLIAVTLFFRESRFLRSPILDVRSARRLVPSSLEPRIKAFVSLESAVPRWSAAALNVVSALALLGVLQLIALEDGTQCMLAP